MCSWDWAFEHTSAFRRPGPCCWEGLRRDTLREAISESLSEVSLALSTLLLQHPPILGNLLERVDCVIYNGDLAANNVINAAVQRYTLVLHMDSCEGQPEMGELRHVSRKKGMASICTATYCKADVECIHRHPRQTEPPVSKGNASHSERTR